MDRHAPSCSLLCAIALLLGGCLATPAAPRVAAAAPVFPNAGQLRAWGAQPLATRDWARQALRGKAIAPGLGVVGATHPPDAKRYNLALREQRRAGLPLDPKLPARLGTPRPRR